MNSQTPHLALTDERFAALADLLRMRGGPAQEAARLVLVDAVGPADAARITGLSPASVSNAVARARAGLRLAQIATGAMPVGAVRPRG